MVTLVLWLSGCQREDLTETSLGTNAWVLDDPERACLGCHPRTWARPPFL